MSDETTSWVEELLTSKDTVEAERGKTKIKPLLDDGYYGIRSKSSDIAMFRGTTLEDQTVRVYGVKIRHKASGNVTSLLFTKDGMEAFVALGIKLLKMDEPNEGPSPTEYLEMLEGAYADDPRPRMPVAAKNVNPFWSDGAMPLGLHLVGKTPDDSCVVIQSRSGFASVMSSTVEASVAKWNDNFGENQ